MCVICSSARGKRQPTEEEIRQMFAKNPDGAGLMWAEGGKVRIAKGFMDVESLLAEIKKHKWGEKDPVVYHFRISTQAGVNKAMTQPFIVRKGVKGTKELCATGTIGMAHNGVIPMTTNVNDEEYSDTARFVGEYLPYLVQFTDDLKCLPKMKMVREMIGASKLAFLSFTGEITTVGTFYPRSGLSFSNLNWTPVETKTPAQTQYVYKSSYPSWKHQLVESARKPEERSKPSPRLNFV